MKDETQVHDVVNTQFSCMIVSVGVGRVTLAHCD